MHLGPEYDFDEVSRGTAAVKFGGSECGTYSVLTPRLEGCCVRQMTRRRETNQHLVIEMPAGKKTERQDVDLDELLEELLGQSYRQICAESHELQRVSIGDYLKLVTLVAERRRQNAPVQRETIVRWEDSFEQDDACN